MLVEAQVTINGSKAAVWAVITDIENAAEIISGIEKIEIVEKPANGLVGLEVARDPHSVRQAGYRGQVDHRCCRERVLQDQSRGCRILIFLTTKRISESGGGMTLTESHESNPQSIAAKLQSIPMRLLFKGVIKKYLLQDLNDIKAAVER